MKKSLIALPLLALGICLACFFPQLIAQEQTGKNALKFKASHFTGKAQVNPQTGELVLAHTWMSFPEPRTLNLTIHYREGTSGKSAPMGDSWLLGVESRLNFYSQHIEWIRPETSKLRFLPLGKGQYISETGPAARLEGRGDTWILTTADSRYYFNRQGRLSQVIESGQKKTYQYNSRGHLLQISQGKGAFLRFHYQKGQLTNIVDSRGRSLHLHYRKGRLSAFEDSEGRHLVLSYDDEKRLSKVNGSALVIKYDKTGMVSALEGNALPNRRYSYRFRGKELVAETTVTDSLGKEKKYSYSAKENKVLYESKSGEKVTLYLNSRDLPLKAVSSQGSTQHFSYDSQGRLKKWKTSVDTWTFTYDKGLKPVRATSTSGLDYQFEYDQHGHLTQVTNSQDEKTNYKYNRRGNLVKIANNEGYWIRSDYDRRGNLSLLKDSRGLKEKYRFDGQGQVRSYEQNQFKLSYSYSHQGRKIEVKNSQGARFQLELNRLQQVVKFTDAGQRLHSLSYNERGQLSRIETEGHFQAAFGYDSEGRLVKRTDAAGRQFSFAYDEDDRVVAWENPLGEKTAFQYSPRGLKSKILPDGTALEFDRNQGGQLTSLQYGKDRDHYRYDKLGRLVEMKNADCHFTYHYNKKGRLRRVKDERLDKSVTYTYDDQGRRKSMETPWGTTRYKYNSQGRLKMLQDGEGRKFHFGYDSEGRQTSIRYPNGTETKCDYDGQGRLVKVESRNGRGEVIFARKYGYDKLSRRVLEKDSQGEKTRYTYDDQGRLKEVITGKKKIRYYYDNVGNRIARQEGSERITYAYDGSGRLRLAGNTRYIYDSRGFLKATVKGKKKTLYHFDHLGQLREVVLPDGEKIEYGYAPNGARVWKKVGDEKTRYIYDGEEVVAEWGKSLQRSYVYGPGIDEPLAYVKKGENPRYYHLDGLSSVTALSNSQGQVVGKYRYSPFGQVLSQSGQSGDNPLRFAGRRYDSEVDLYYNRARYYQPQTGRFLSPDPLLFAGGVNFYAYCGNDPVNYVDPYGTFALWNGLKNSFRDVKDKWNRGVNWVGDRVEDGKDLFRKGRLLAGIGPREKVYEARHRLYDSISRPFEKMAASIRNKSMKWLDSAPYVVGQIGYFAWGVGEGFYKATKGTITAILHPLRTGKELYRAVVNYKETWQGLKWMAGEYWRQLKYTAKHDPKNFARMIGNITGEVLFAIAGTKGLDKLGKTKWVAKIKEAGKIRGLRFLRSMRGIAMRSTSLRTAARGLRSLLSNSAVVSMAERRAIRHLLHKMSSTYDPKKLAALEKRASRILKKHGMAPKPSRLKRAARGAGLKPAQIKARLRNMLATVLHIRRKINRYYPYLIRKQVLYLERMLLETLRQHVPTTTNLRWLTEEYTRLLDQFEGFLNGEERRLEGPKTEGMIKKLKEGSD